MNQITFNKQKGGLARTLANEDHVSGIIVPFDAPASWATNIREFKSIQQVEAAEILEYDLVFGLVHYHAQEFFRKQPNGNLFLAFAPESGNEVRNKTAGRVRQWALWGTEAGMETAQTFMDALEALYAPALMVFGIQQATAPVLASLVDLNTVNYPSVSFLIAGDGDNEGKDIADSLGLAYIPSVGAALGAVALAAVHESIAWVQKFRMDKAELESPVMADGILLADMLEADLELLNDKRYLFFRRHVGIAGVYFNDSHTAIISTDDYSTIENNRAMQKAMRNLRTALLPQLAAPAYVDAETGKLSLTTIEYFKSIGEKPLEQMVKDGELSGFALDIDPDQNILSTSTLEVVVQLVPVGVARNIVVNIGFTLQIA
jgi:hypothetical protein